ncbi:MAG TPA: response regulator [Terracidiphilus sp.]|jgi:DNA-binding NtrC family response regulator
MTSDPRKVLIVDDDPSHLEIYGLLMEQAGYEAVPALVKFAGTDIPRDESIGLVLLDYRLHSLRTSTEVAREIRGLFPAVAIVVLSDLWTLPADIAPFVTEFVRKGQPEKLLQVVERLLPRPGGKGGSGQDEA